MERQFFIISLYIYSFNRSITRLNCIFQSYPRPFRPHFSIEKFHRNLRFPRKTIEPNLDERLFHLILIQKFNFLYFHQEKNNNSTLRITVPRWISRIPCLQPLSSRSIRDGKRRVNDPFDTAPNTKSFPRRNILVYREKSLH